MTRSLRGGVLTALAISSTLIVLAGCGSAESKPKHAAAVSKSTSASASTTSAPSGQTFTLGLQEVYSVLPALVAEDEGFLKKHGIAKLQTVTFTSLPAFATALAKGEVDAGLQTPSLLQTYNATTSGSKLAFVAPGQAFNISWIARKGSGVPVATAANWQSTVRAWRGKKIGVSATGGITELVTNYLLEQVGLKPSDVTITAVAPGAPQLAAMKAGVVDLTVGDSFGTQVAIAAGAGTDVLDTGLGQGPSEWQGILESGYMASRETIEKHSELFADFAAALKEARAFLANAANRSAIEASIVKHTQVSATIAKALYPFVHEFTVPLTTEVYEKTTKALVAAKVLKSPAPTYEEAVYDVEG